MAGSVADILCDPEDQPIYLSRISGTSVSQDMLCGVESQTVGSRRSAFIG